VYQFWNDEIIIIDCRLFCEVSHSYFERLEMMDDPGKPPITLYRESNRVAALKRGLSIEDQKIVDRLQELRGDSRRRKSTETIGEEEVAARLAKLKGNSSTESQ